MFQCCISHVPTENAGTNQESITLQDINCNPKNLGFIWAGPRKDEYINASWARRQVLLSELRNMTLGLLWFVQNDEAVPAAERAGNRQFGLCKDGGPGTATVATHSLLSVDQQ